MNGGPGMSGNGPVEQMPDNEPPEIEGENAPQGQGRGRHHDSEDGDTDDSEGDDDDDDDDVASPQLEGKLFEKQFSINNPQNILNDSLY